MDKRCVGQERRRFQRLEVPLFILYRLETDDAMTMFKAIIRNIGGGGLMFEAEREVSKGDALYLEIYQPSIKYNDLIFLIYGRAKVIWVDRDAEANKYQIGAEFVTIEKDSRDKIVEYVERIEKRW